MFASSAWHWLDHERALPEIARVLEPGGTLGIVWTRWANTPWIDELLQDLARWVPDLHAVRERVEHSLRLGPLPAGAPFEVADSQTFTAARRTTRDEAGQLFTTYSWFIKHPRRSELRQLIQQHVARWDETVEIPVASNCWRIRHLPDACQPRPAGPRSNSPL